MTKEEAEQLIAEIENRLCDTNGPLSDGYDEISFSHTKKIIKHFANKPPKEGWMSNDNSANCFYLRECSPPTDVFCFQIEYNALDKIERFYLDKSKLKHLRDNINLMLEYLTNDEN